MNTEPATFNEDVKSGFESTRSVGLVEEAPLVDHDLRIERSGWIKVDVGEEMAASKRLRKAAKSLDAIVMAFNDRSVTLKMPSKNIETLMATLEAVDGWEIDEFDFSAWDRTGEYFSVSKRMESLTVVRTRLLQLIEKAEWLDDLLKLEKRLEEVQGQLDQFEGAKRRIELVAGRVDVRIIFDD
ncbi:MAG: DUF4349 domain-containing protein [Planctomycetes bacterium]|nr:DUF4349 domain-containing protein [Planctomycetota bacterium]